MDRKSGFITRQARRLGSGEINRRRFVMQALSAGVTLPTAMSLASRAEAQPRKGGLLRQATHHAFAGDRIDPALSSNGFLRILQSIRGDQLTRATPTGIRGALAETVEPSKDARTWVFTIRVGVAFHNGKPLMPADVIASLSRHRSGLLSQVVDIRQDGPLRVVVKLQTPNLFFDRLVSDPRLTILPADDGDIDPQTRLGTGPYVLETLTPDTSARFTRNPDYWRPDTAHFDTVELTSIPDNARRLHAALNGDVDFVDGIDPAGVALIRQTPTLGVFETAGPRRLALSLSKFNPELRHALRHAIRQQELVDKVFFGHGRLSADTSILTASDDAQVTFDAVRAAAHFARSNHSGPLVLGAASDCTGLGSALHLIATSAREAGIPVAPPSATNASADCHATVSIQHGTCTSGAHSPDISLVWINDISAHHTALRHPAQTSPHDQDGGCGIARNWWFA